MSDGADPRGADEDRGGARIARTFVDTDLRGARFVRADLGGAVMRGVEIAGADIDSPWLLDEGGSLLIDGVDVVPYVDAELDRRFPGRALRRAQDPEGLRAAWVAVEATWQATVARAASMPGGSVDVRVDGEWSFAETLRHLVMATDTWLRRAILGVPQPYHPLGMPNAEFAGDGEDASVFAAGTPSFAAVLAARADRIGMVRELLAGIAADGLGEERPNPWAPDRSVTVGACLRTILEEEWEHHRYAVRDLDALGRRPA